MIKNVFLKNNKGFKWFCNENICVKGSFFDNKNNYYSNTNLIDYFTNIETEKDFLRKIKDANGVFTVIIFIKNIFFIATDIIRMFPVFYIINNNELFISDNINVFIKKNKNIKKNKVSVNEIMASGYVAGNKTFYNNIFQIQAGEKIIYNNNKIYNSFYYRHLTTVLNIQKEISLYEVAVTCINNTFKRLIKSLNNRTAIIPLSGGYDSRLIATMLKRNNYEKVICYTYGKKGHNEIEISKKVAQMLNFKWHFIEYNNELLKDFLKEDNIYDYVNFNAQKITFPFFQEYFAVKYLKENKLIPEDSIFIPGHSGDFIGGSHLRSNNKNISKISQAVKIIYLKHYSLNTINKQFSRKIKHEIRCFTENAILENNKKLNYSIIEDWNFKERQSKMITNSANVYNYFGYEHRLPFWDTEFVSFFKNLPFEYKIYKIFFNKILTQEYFSLYNLDFNFDLQPTRQVLKKQKIKQKIKKLLPNFIKNKFTKNNDWLNSNFRSSQYIEFLHKRNITINTKYLSNNEITIQWYLSSIVNNLF